MFEEYISSRERYLQGQQEHYFVRRYWNLVKITLFDVLNQNNRNELMKEVINLQNSVISRPIEEQMLFYHAEPLDVAVDLLGLETTDLEEDQITNYLEIANGNFEDSDIFYW